MQTSLQTYSLRELSLYFLKLGATGFGGPVALVGYMHKHLVEQRKWISESDYREGLTLAQLAPGPLAAQLAIYLGYVHHRLMGATIAGIAFVLPSFIMVVLLGIAYVHFGGLPWIQHLFYGVSACVIGIIAFSAFKLARKSISGDYVLWSIFLLSAVLTYITRSESVWLFLGAGIVYAGFKFPLKRSSAVSISLPLFLLQIPQAGIGGGKLAQIFFFFCKAGAFVFGSGLAIVPFLYSGVVKEYGWLSEQQFMDAVAVAMITPGPVVITVAFIGYLTHGFSGAAIAALATFLPCYLLTVLPAPYFKKYGKRPLLKAFVEGVTAAAIGAIAGAVVILSLRTLKDAPTVIIALVTILILIQLRNVREPWLIAASACAGLLLKTVL